MRKLAYSAPQSLSEVLAVFQEHGEGGRALAGRTSKPERILRALGKL